MQGVLAAELPTFTTYHCMQSNEGLPQDLPKTDPPITTQTVSLLLANILQVFGREKLLTPDDLRGNYGSLREALNALGPAKFWPDLDVVRGKVVVVVGGTDSPMH